MNYTIEFIGYKSGQTCHSYFNALMFCVEIDIFDLLKIKISMDFNQKYQFLLDFTFDLLTLTFTVTTENAKILSHIL